MTKSLWTSLRKTTEIPKLRHIFINRRMKILIVEDEEELASFLQVILEKECGQTTVCSSVEDVIKNGYESSHDLIILDLKGKRGESLIAHMKKKKINVPTLVLSALGQINTKIELINLGADDYLTKPFDAQELIARVKALYRRYLQAGFKDEEDFGEFTFFSKQNKIKRGNKDILLTKNEGQLFELLLRNRGKTVPLEDILKNVWKAKVGYHSNIVQATVRRLRRKVDAGFPHKLIRNMHGIGYAVMVPEKKEKE